MSTREYYRRKIGYIDSKKPIIIDPIVLCRVVKIIKKLHEKN